MTGDPASITCDLSWEISPDCLHEVHSHSCRLALHNRVGLVNYPCRRRLVASSQRCKNIICHFSHGSRHTAAQWASTRGTECRASSGQPHHTVVMVGQLGSAVRPCLVQAIAFNRAVTLSTLAHSKRLLAHRGTQNLFSM